MTTIQQRLRKAVEEYPRMALNVDPSLLSDALAEIERLSSALRAVLARDSEWAPSGAKNDCNCINLSHEADIEYETGKCPHQLARKLLEETGGGGE